MTVPPPPGATPPPPPPPPPMPPGPGMPPMPPSGGQSQSNGQATTAMILGIVGFLCVGGLAGIPAIIFGFMGKKKADELGGTGRGQAITGIVLGILSVVWSVVAIIIFVIAAANADTTVNSIKDDINRNGTVASSSDYDVTDAKVDVSSYGSVTYTAYIENTGDFETGFELSVECTDNFGTKDTQSAYATAVSPGDKKKVDAYFSFDSDTTSVDCEVAEVLYGY